MSPLTIFHRITARRNNDVALVTLQLRTENRKSYRIVVTVMNVAGMFKDKVRPPLYPKRRMRLEAATPVVHQQ